MQCAFELNDLVVLTLLAILTLTCGKMHDRNMSRSVPFLRVAVRASPLVLKLWRLDG